MKNIHLIPTDKPSRLGYLTKKGKEVFNDLRLFEKPMPNILDSENQNIYITSDEEITGFENNIWVIKGERIFLWQNMMALVSNNKPKKIILTTDQSLNGVQAIDDEFLEWFVKNPSCERVAVQNKKLFDGFLDPEYGSSKWRFEYKIIIPKEEPNPFELPKALPDDVFYESLEEPKQETLEEAADNWVNKPIIGTKRESFIAGAKWQQERSYSAEEVTQLLIKFNQEIQEVEDVREWFEQFKKK